MNQDMKTDCESIGQVIDFADQATMGSLYQRADICICRGGTTSLAEMDIFGIRKLIVPLPITHDQQTNAQYYVDHHGDHLIVQDSQIISSLQQRLEQYI
jgi:UDP-N-acetylglucosamine:LPS N-acetylglucosamine transferase